MLCYVKGKFRVNDKLGKYAPLVHTLASEARAALGDALQSLSSAFVMDSKRQLNVSSHLH